MRRAFWIALACGASLAPAQADRTDLRALLHGGPAYETSFGAHRSGGGWLDGPSASSSGGASESNGNRQTYLAYQTALSTYVYGIGVPLGFGADEPRVLIAAPLITAPIAFGVHLWTSSKLDFSDAQLKATTYIPTFGVYAATALPLAFSPDAGDGYRIGTFVSAGVYPLALWYAQQVGAQYKSNPKHLDDKLMFGLGYGFLGLVAPVLYYDRPSRNSEEILRVGLAQSVGMAVLGNVVADYYNPPASSGVLVGMASHAALGGLAGIEFASLADASASPRPWLGAVLIGSTLGFTEGVFFFKNSRDSQERSDYSLLGMGGGAMMGLGMQLLFQTGGNSNYGEKVAWSSWLVGGAFVGYCATYALTSGLERTAVNETPGKSAEPLHWSFNPVPQPEYTMSRGEPASRWRVPGYAYHF